jgi:hypothetical protein
MRQQRLTPAPRVQVKKLEKALQEETALHSVLEGALQRAAVTLADMAYLPANVRTVVFCRGGRIPFIHSFQGVGVC